MKKALFLSVICIALGLTGCQGDRSNRAGANRGTDVASNSAMDQSRGQMRPDQMGQTGNTAAATPTAAAGGTHGGTH